MKVGGVTLERGKIVNMVLDSVPNPPSFDAENAGEFTFSTSDGLLRFNNGVQSVALNTTVSENPNLIESLGSNWLNEDLSFNPVPFNDLPGITVGSTDSLFVVIDQLTALIDGVATVTIDEIDVSNVVTPDMSVLVYNSGDLIFVEIETVLEGSSISLNFDNLEGFNITDTSRGNMIVFNEVNELVSKKVNYTYTMITPSSSHLIVHNLGVQHCAVFCIDPATNMMITPTSIQFTAMDRLTVNLPASTGLKAFVMNFDPPAVTP